MRPIGEWLVATSINLSPRYINSIDYDVTIKTCFIRFLVIVCESGFQLCIYFWSGLSIGKFTI